MPAIIRLYDFLSGTVIQSSQVDDEFNQLVNTINLLPDKDGTVQSNLNADLLDGFHASVLGGANTIPVCVAGDIQVALNADLLDGQHATDIAASAFDVGTKLLFYQAAPPGGWTAVTPPTDHILTWKSGAVGGTNAANSWTVSGLTVSIANHVLTIEELAAHFHVEQPHVHTIPPHTHGVKHLVGNRTESGSVNTSYVNSVSGTLTNTELSAASNTGSAGSANTTVVGNDVGHNHTGTVSQNGLWRPPASYIIIASKD